MEKLYSIRPNARIMSLLAEIVELERGNKDSTRTAIFERALIAAKNVNDWTPIYETSFEMKKDIEVPESFQVRAEEEEINAIAKKIRSTVEEIQKLRMVLTVKLILINYLIVLRKKVAAVGVEKVEDISASEMVKLLVEIVIMNRSADIYLIEEIKEKLIEWRGKVYDNDNASI